MTGQTTKQTSSSFPAKARGFLQRAGARLRFLRWRGRRLWKVPGGYRITPALAGSIIFTLASLTVTAVSWALVRLLPNRELMDRLIADLPHSLLEILGQLPELLRESTPTTEMVTGALVSQDVYIITYACGVVTAFSFLLLLIVIWRRM